MFPHLEKTEHKKDVWMVAIRLMTHTRKFFRIVFTDTKYLPDVVNGMCV